MRIKIFLAALIFVLQITGLHETMAGQSMLHIAMVLWRGETAAERGFRSGLARYGYDVDYDIFDAEQDKTKLGVILRQQLNIHKYDYVYTFGTTASLQVKNYLNGQIPHIFNIVTDPVEAGLVKSLQSSGDNLCGVKSGVPLNLQIENAHQVIGFKRLGYIFNPREKNSNVILDGLLDISRDLHFEVIKLRSPPVQERLMSNIDKILAGSVLVDAVYLPTDSFIVSNAEAITSRLQQARVPAVGAMEKYISAGALMGIVADYAELGVLAAYIVQQNQKGTRLEDIPIQTPTNPKLMINQKLMEALNFKLPEAAMQKAELLDK